MSSLGEHKGHGNLTETSRQPEDTKALVNGILQHFDALPSRLDRVIFKYIYVYLLGLFFPSELLLILFLLNISPQFQVQTGGVLLMGGLNLLSVVFLISIIWAFNIWRVRTPKTLRDLVEKRRIYVPDGDAPSAYLRFLEDYRAALTSPKRYLLSGFLMMILGLVSAYAIVIILSLEHTTRSLILLGVVGLLLYTLEALGGLYCFGIVTWTLYTSGCSIRKLVQVFEFNIQPFHPDQCGGLKLLGNFCFGLVSPLLICSGLSFGFILLSVSGGGMASVSLVLREGFSLLLLVYAFSVIVLAFVLPMRDIHTKMVSEGERVESIYLARIQALRAEIQVLLDANQVEEAKAVQEKKALVETLYIPYPTWPFRFRSKIFSTVLGVSGSLLIGVMTAALQQYFLPAILSLFFRRP